MTTVTVGDHTLELGGEYLVELEERTSLADDPAAMHAALERDGYVLMRGFHDAERVERARQQVLEHMADDGLLDPDAPVEEGTIHPEYFDETFDMTGASWTHYPALQELVDGEGIMGFFDRFLEYRALAYDFKWGRAIATGQFTGFHVDRIFMNRGTEQLYTVWRPIGDCPLEMGPLVVCPGSHAHETLRETYGTLDVDRDVVEGWFSKDPYDVIDTVGGPLATAAFEAGDALIFGPYLMHGSLTNETDRFRISIDTRYQSVADPVDGRWVGREPIGHYNWPSPDETSMETLRAEWGLT